MLAGAKVSEALWARQKVNPIVRIQVSQEPSRTAPQLETAGLKGDSKI